MNTTPARKARIGIAEGRLAAIHGLVLDEGNPMPTLRELLRQWRNCKDYSHERLKSLAERTDYVLEAVDVDGRVVRRDV